MRQLAVSAVVLFVLPSFANAQYWVGGDEKPIQPKISTSGSATVQVVPDEAILNLGIETRMATLPESKKRNDDAVSELIARAKSLGIKAEHVKTDYLHIEPLFDTREGQRVMYACNVRRSIVITLKDLSKFEEMLSLAVEAGVTNIHNVEFRSTELRKYKDQARSMAIRAAKEKAIALAGELGQSIGQPLSITESTWDYWDNYRSWWGYGSYQSVGQNVVQAAAVDRTNAADESSTIAPGVVGIRATINVLFEMKAKAEGQVEAPKEK